MRLQVLEYLARTFLTARVRTQTYKLHQASLALRVKPHVALHYCIAGTCVLGLQSRFETSKLNLTPLSGQYNGSTRRSRDVQAFYKRKKAHLNKMHFRVESRRL